MAAAERAAASHKKRQKERENKSGRKKQSIPNRKKRTKLKGQDSKALAQNYYWVKR